MKPNLLTITLLLTTSAIIAQNTRDKIFHLDSLHNITTGQNYKYTRVVEDYDSKKNTYAVYEYYKSGKISMSATTKDKNILKLEGTRIDYYENGNKKRVSNYINNKLIGKEFSWYENNVKKSEKEIIDDAKNKTSETNVISFWNPEGKQTVIEGNGQVEESDEDSFEKGEIKDGKKHGLWIGKNLKTNSGFNEIYKKGKFQSGISTDENNSKFRYKEIMEKPVPKKGIQEFYQYIGRNYKTPEIPGLKGKVHITFVVDKDGKLINFKVIKDIDYGTGKEAIRVLENAESWIPGKMRGMPVKVMYSLPITIQTAEENYARK